MGVQFQNTNPENGTLGDLPTRDLDSTFPSAKHASSTTPVITHQGHLPTNAILSFIMTSMWHVTVVSRGSTVFWLEFSLVPTLPAKEKAEIMYGSVKMMEATAFSDSQQREVDYLARVKEYLSSITQLQNNTIENQLILQELPW
jgi:hypothetical protein